MEVQTVPPSNNIENGNQQSTASRLMSPPTKKPKTKYPKIFQCTGYGDCKMTFTRSEHLARHIRKHTGERPFRCHCNRTFSRLDNLRQHIQTVHANEHHILHAPPPPPLPHSNKVPVAEFQHQAPPQQPIYQPQQHVQQSMTNTIITNHPSKHQNIIIEHHPAPHHHGGMSNMVIPPANPQMLYQPPPFRPKHRPRPIAVPNADKYLETDNNSPPGSPMNSSQNTPSHQVKFGYSPTSPLFANSNNTNSTTNNHLMIQDHGLHHTAGTDNTKIHATSQSYYAQAYPPIPPLPTTPVNGAAMDGPTPTSPSTPYHHHQPAQQHSYQQQQPANYYQQGYQYQNKNNYYVSPPNELHSYPSMAGMSSTSSSRAQSSTVSTPGSSTTNTSSWLSSVLCDNSNDSNNPQVEDRPHTWGPSSNRYSSPNYDGDDNRNSALSQLVRITEESHISTPQLGTTPEGQLPSLSTLLNEPHQQQQQQQQQQQKYHGSHPYDPVVHNRPQLSANRSYTKNLILPRPDSYPPPKGYILPIADTRPSALPPAGSDLAVPKSATTYSSGRNISSSNLSKPLPPLPSDAQKQKQQQQSSDGMDVLMQAAGV